MAMSAQPSIDDTNHHIELTPPSTQPTSGDQPHPTAITIECEEPLTATSTNGQVAPPSATSTTVPVITIHPPPEPLPSSSNSKLNARSASNVDGRRPSLSRQYSSNGPVVGRMGSTVRRLPRPPKKMKLTESWPGSHHIRRLFRLFDVDNNGAITPSELKKGLASLGFDVTNVAQLRVLQQELDVDHTGLIRESEFIHAFRTLNRKAIEAKLKAIGESPDSAEEEEPPVSIQLMKIGHHRDSNGVQSSFHHEKHITPASLPDILKKEEEESGSDKAIRWLDICGLHSGVLALISNFYMLPHEMLGEEVELDHASHCDFFTGRPNDTAPPINPVGAWKHRVAHHHLASSAVDFTGGASATSAGSGAKPSSTSAPTAATAIHTVPSHTGAAPLNHAPGLGPVDPTSPSTPEPSSPSTSELPHPERHASMGDPMSPHSHCSMKLLIHSLQLHNFPLVSTEDGVDLKCVSFRTYKENPCVIRQMPIYIVIANDHTLITVRRPTKPPTTPSAAAAAAASSSMRARLRAMFPAWTRGGRSRSVSKAGKTTAAPASSNPTHTEEDILESAAEEEPEENDMDDPSDLFFDFINTLADTDSTSLSSVLGLTSAKVLALKLWEDIIDSNWSLRDAFKEWKIWLDQHVDEISDQYYLQQLNDFERLSSTAVRIYRPLLNTIAGLSGEHIDVQDTAEGHPNSAKLQHHRRELTHQQYLFPERTEYLKEVITSLRILYRNISRQFEQSTLSVQLVKGLREQYRQRIADRSNDTLYLLTVITSCALPLQISSSIYGMNWDNFPELHYVNGYYYWWGFNIIIIFMIAMLFKFQHLTRWVREHAGMDY